MKVHVIKYVGRFGGAEAKGIVFVKNVPTLINDAALAKILCEQPDFSESSLAELEAYGAEQAVNPTLTTAPELVFPNPVTKPVVVAAPKENA